MKRRNFIAAIFAVPLIKLTKLEKPEMQDNLKSRQCL